MNPLTRKGCCLLLGMAVFPLAAPLTLSAAVSSYSQILVPVSMDDIRTTDNSGFGQRDYYYGNATNFLVSRLAMEYSLGSLPANAQLTSLNFTYMVAVSSGGGDLMIYGSAGNGIADAPDVNTYAHYLGTIPTTTGGPARGNLSLSYPQQLVGTAPYMALGGIGTGSAWSSVTGSSLKVNYTVADPNATVFHQMPVYDGFYYATTSDPTNWNLFTDTDFVSFTNADVFSTDIVLRRGVVEFDLSSLPAGTQIRSASITMDSTGIYRAADAPLGGLVLSGFAATGAPILTSLPAASALAGVTPELAPWRPYTTALNPRYLEQQIADGKNLGLLLTSELSGVEVNFASSRNLGKLGFQLNVELYTPGTSAPRYQMTLGAVSDAAVEISAGTPATFNLQTDALFMQAATSLSPERRGAITFDTRSLPAPSPLTDASLLLDVVSYSTDGTRYPSFAVYAYTDDAAYSDADWSNLLLVGQSGPITDLVPVQIPLDVQALASLLTAGDRVSFLLVPNTQDQAGIYSAESYHGQPPQLTLAFAPEPATILFLATLPALLARRPAPARRRR